MNNNQTVAKPSDTLLTLRNALDSAYPLYILPKDPVAREVLVPAMKATQSLDIMMGYFSSSSFSEVAPGLASFLRNSQCPLRLVISPFLTDTDFEMLASDPDQLKEIAKQILIDDLPDENHIAKHSLECLAWLIDRGRVEIKVAVMRDSLFHSKVWLFQDSENRVALHGSMNFTKNALTRNREQLTLSRDWKGEEAIYHINKLENEFRELWSGGDTDCYVIDLPDAICRAVIEKYKKESPPDEDKMETVWQKAHGISEDTPNEEYSQTAELRIPSYLKYETGEFAHQGEAVNAWISAGERGILEMATGAGKTITSMICATKLQDKIGNLLVVVSAPYRPLIEQWCGEIREFGVRPINLTTVGGPAMRDREIKQAARRLRMGHTRAEVLVVSNDTLCTEGFIASLNTIPGEKLLIADECHNLGAEGFSKNPPMVFNYRLGLSATPVRQYDEDGTEALVKYFGDICFAFTLEQAIGKCLTEYDYCVHLIELSDSEMQLWYELTEKISSMAWKFTSGKTDPYLENLLRQRRLVLETASKKVDILNDLLEELGPRNLKYTLIYTTDKDPEQLNQVNKVLKDKGILFRQLTYEETCSREQTNQILSKFQDGSLQVLTAKRVLDEGVNIPQIELAYILASTTVKRQWVQRRGRLLRTCKAIGKKYAIIHDFVVLPPETAQGSQDNLDDDARKLVRSELERVWEFARLSRNSAQKGGSYEAVQLLQSLANEEIV